MKLQDVVYGTDGFYFCGKNKVYCYVVTCNPCDGASLIIEQMEEFDDGTFDLGDNLFYTEACHLRTTKDLT